MSRESYFKYCAVLEIDKLGTPSNKWPALPFFLSKCATVFLYKVPSNWVGNFP